MDPRELPEWGLFAVGTSGVVAGCEDGVISREGLDQELRDWSAGHFELRGRRLRLSWVEQEKADALHREWGW
ncbi:hypothetical protein [Streptomyces albipurpureus]|uniref:Uncharacterized protein n=1 Tax=Streptomyces albipurpureus TaxID=2897419 RepID=A0ABT0UZH5_9ACTN|nr:hypothetical protein [Streptomyces sp. CWNU-1]MCM2393369.1 hypothetical protein [Streptomyces sp. CWNU-1]